jgi:hypothetical protein
MTKAKAAKKSDKAVAVDRTVTAGVAAFVRFVRTALRSNLYADPAHSDFIGAIDDAFVKPGTMGDKRGTNRRCPPPAPVITPRLRSERQ